MASKIEVDEIFNAGGDNDTGIDLATNDQILLKVANATRLTMNSTGQPTIVGEGGTTTTSLQQGLAKCWIQFNGTGTVAIADSNNIGSLTDNGTGDYDINLTNAHTNTSYSVALASGNFHTGHDGNTSSSKVNIAVYNNSHAYANSALVHGQTFGDLA